MNNKAPALRWNPANNTAYCASCGAQYSAQQTRQAELGNPPVGILVLDEGQTLLHDCAAWLDFKEGSGRS